MASIVDRPKKSNQDDLLGIEKYTDGLIRFIESSETPITIGIQGEWGSGKTSLLNTIQKDLETNHYTVWINTWEYSLLSTSDETLIKIISSLVTQISELTKEKPSEQGKKAIKAVGTVLKEFGGFFGGTAGKIAEKAGDALQSSMETKHDNSIKALRDALEQVIKVTLDDNPSKKAFIFFIDDLDRLDPTVAVNILELIKNLFDLDKCIFILAIDYSVVVKGLQSKFGKMTDENEWEFRAFFDKIIQLPFSMPTNNYNIGKYLKKLLVGVGYFDSLDDKEKIKGITDIIDWSVGTNPRALKRLVNSVSLIETIRDDKIKITEEERVVEFALICIQIAYPTIYGLIQKNHEFTSWNQQFISDVLKSKSVDESDLKGLISLDEFNDEWEQNIWRICQVSSLLKQKTYQISKLLNFINDEVSTIDDKNDNSIDVLVKLLSMSSVTSVNAENIISVQALKAKARSPKKLQLFKKTMIDFIENDLNQKYLKYLDEKYISIIKINPKINSGNLYLSIKKNALDFDLCICTDYTKIEIYVNNRNSKERSLNTLKQWFENNMKTEFPSMTFRNNRTKNRTITLEATSMPTKIDREDVLDKYKEIIKHIFDIFLPKISKY